MGGYTDSYRTKDPSLILDRWILDICTVQYNTYIHTTHTNNDQSKQTKDQIPKPVQHQSLLSRAATAPTAPLMYGPSLAVLSPDADAD